MYVYTARRLNVTVGGQGQATTNNLRSVLAAPNSLKIAVASHIAEMDRGARGADRGTCHPIGRREGVGNYQRRSSRNRVRCPDAGWSATRPCWGSGGCMEGRRPWQTSRSRAGSRWSGEAAPPASGSGEDQTAPHGMRRPSTVHGTRRGRISLFAFRADKLRSCLVYEI
jgi:hypothetical protein